MRSILLVAVLSATALLAEPSHARAPQDLEAIHRDTRVAENVFDSAFRDAWRDELRVSGVSVEYLADQGVLVSVKVTRPWITITDRGSQVTIDKHISFPEVPELVQEILAKLDIPVDPYHPEALEDLRALREEQRELRLEDRDVRKKLRSERRDLVRAEDGDERDDIKENIAELERELAAVDAQMEALRLDIEDQMSMIATLNKRSDRTPARAEDPDIQTTVVEVACEYGTTLKFLDADNYLNFAIRYQDDDHYYVFKMDHVNQCSRGEMQAERLLELGYQYSDGI